MSWISICEILCVRTKLAAKVVKKSVKGIGGMESKEKMAGRLLDPLRAFNAFIQSHKFMALATIFGLILTFISTLIAFLAYQSDPLVEAYPDLDPSQTISALSESIEYYPGECADIPEGCAFRLQQQHQLKALERLTKESMTKIMRQFDCGIWAVDLDATVSREHPQQIALETARQHIEQLIQLVNRVNLNVNAAAMGMHEELHRRFRRTNGGWQGIAKHNADRLKQVQQLSERLFSLCGYLLDECPTSCVMSS